jgi:hypothetical protein
MIPFQQMLVSFVTAADAVANRAAELMGDGQPDAQVIPLRA